MPRIPTYDQQQQTLRPIDTGSASPGLFTAGAEQQMRVGAAVQSAAQGAGKVLAQMQDRQNADMLFRAETAIKDEYIEFQNTLRERRGQNAWGAAQEAKQWWDDKGRQHSEGLENEAQRGLFRQSVAKLRTSSLDAVSSYEAGERRRSLEESAQASIVGSINLAATNYGDQTALAGAKSDVLKRTDVLAQLNGWAPEVRDAKVAENLTNFHAQVIQNRVDSDPGGAREYYEANKAEIAGSSQNEIEKVLKIGGLKTLGQTFADEVEASGASEKDAVAQARKRYTGEEEEAAVLAVRTRFREKVEAVELSQRQAADTAYDIYAKTKRLGNVPATVLNAMDGKTRLALEHDAADAAAGVATKTDPSVYYELRQMAVSDPATFRKLDLRQFFPKLDQGDREKFIDMQQPDKLNDAVTLQQQLNVMHNQLGWGDSDSEKAKKGAFDRATSGAIFLEQRRLGKPLNQQERQTVIDRMALEGEVMSGSMFVPDADRRFYQTYGTSDAAKFEPEISSTDREAIVTRFTELRKRKPTGEEILQAYRKWKGL